MQTRIPLDPAKFVQPRLTQIRGVSVEVFVSPYDVPTAVVGDFDRASNQFVIDFRYSVEDEPEDAIPQEEGITFKVGRYSQRLRRVELDVDRYQASFVELKVRVDKAIDRLTNSNIRNRKLRAENYRIARQVIDENSDVLLEPLASR